MSQMKFDSILERAFFISRTEQQAARLKRMNCFDVAATLTTISNALPPLDTTLAQGPAPGRTKFIRAGRGADTATGPFVSGSSSQFTRLGL